jgi:hypothetical protein
MNTFRLKNRITDEHFIETCSNSTTMSEACRKLQTHYNSFRKRAIELNCFIPNQAGKGIHRIRKDGLGKISLTEILQGKHPSYQTFKLKNRLLKEGIKSNKCDVCNAGPEWNNKPLHCELDHIDGNSSNHKTDNLRMLCPNCHSQTPTFRALNRNLSLSRQSS